MKHNQKPPPPIYDSKCCKSYNYLLDVVKGVACIAVVFMHCEFPGYLGVLVQTISRFAVPFFFMVSGYYCFAPKVQRKSMKPKLQHISRIVLGVTLFYGIVTLLYRFFGFTEYYTWLSSIKTLVINWLVFNCPPIGSGQMWFLWALLYVYIIWALVRYFGIENKIIMFLPLFIVTYIILAQGLYLVGLHVPNMIYRNAYIEGLTFFILGYAIHLYQDKIKMNNETLIAILLVSTLLCPLERFAMGRDFGVNICTFPQVTAFYLLAVKNPSYKGNWTHLLNYIGKNCSMMVYILHPFVWHLTEQCYSSFRIEHNIVALYIMPICVVSITILLALSINIFQKRILIR